MGTLCRIISINQPLISPTVLLRTTMWCYMVGIILDDYFCFEFEVYWTLFLSAKTNFHIFYFPIRSFDGDNNIWRMSLRCINRLDLLSCSLWSKFIPGEDTTKYCATSGPNSQRQSLWPWGLRCFCKVIFQRHLWHLDFGPRWAGSAEWKYPGSFAYKRQVKSKAETLAGMFPVKIY